MEKNELCPKWRFRAVRIAFSLLFIAIVVRLFQIQVINSSRYKAQAREQQWGGEEIQAKRGAIYTADNYPIATSTATYTLYYDRSNDEDTRTTVNQILEVLPEYPKADLAKIDDEAKKWIKITDNLTWDQKEQLTKSNNKSFHFEEKYNRDYPEEGMLGQVLGFVGYDKNSKQIGYFGLEQFYDGDLRGQNGWLMQEKSALGDPIIWGQSEKIETVNGSELHLTIDRSVQYMVETMLEEGVKKYAAKSGSVIIVDPQTGKIITMANYPRFNPKEYTNDEHSRNNAIASVYEPGSVLKALTMSSAIDKNIVTPGTTYNDNGPKVFTGYKVDNWDGKHHGEETMIEILQHSNNLGAAWVGQRVGDRNLMEYFKKFGLGEKTNIDLEGEESGVLYKNYPLKDIELVNAAFGQGISVTPLQLVMAFSSIVNGGKYMKPYLVEKIVGQGTVTEIKPKVEREVLSSDSAETMIYMLTEAVAGGEAKFFVLKNYKVAGKTGTAQVPIPGGYAEDRTNATFIGFFPSYRNFVMLVKLEEPKSPSGYAAETAVPLWMQIAELLANYYGLSPDKNKQ